VTKPALHEGLPFEEGTTSSLVSTGELPQIDQVRGAVTEAYEFYRSVDSGVVADYIPALARAAPQLFAISVVGSRGRFFEIGDVERRFSIQSVSKPFVFALVCEAIGGEPARQRLGVNSTGFPFNSLMAVELNEERTMNPLVNAGAIATTSLLPGDTAAEKWASAREGLSRFAGRELSMSDDVYASESASNQRNQGIAHLLASYGRLYFDPDEATDVYTRQCSLEVTVHDLAVMAATLANGGMNPTTGARVVGAGVCRRVLATMATAGLYELSGDWLYEIGMPGKSGVSGGVVTVSPGKGGLATYSPPLDAAGNSVRGQLATKYLSERLGLNLFTSRPVAGTVAAADQAAGSPAGAGPSS
jgi:glutaminase